MQEIHVILHTLNAHNHSPNFSLKSVNIQISTISIILVQKKRHAILILPELAFSHTPHMIPAFSCFSPFLILNLPLTRFQKSLLFLLKTTFLTSVRSYKPIISSFLFWNLQRKRSRNHAFPYLLNDKLQISLHSFFPLSTKPLPYLHFLPNSKILLWVKFPLKQCLRFYTIFLNSKTKQKNHQLLTKKKLLCNMNISRQSWNCSD